MAGGLLTGGRESDILGYDRRLVVVVVVLGVATTGGAALLVVDGGDGTGTDTYLDSVPAGVEGVIHVDGNVTDEQLTLDTLDAGLEVGWWFVDSSEAPGVGDLTDALSTNEIAFEEATVFLRRAEGDAPDYAGSVLTVGEGSQASDIVALIASEVGEEQLETTTYNGVDVRKLDLVEAAGDAQIEGVTDEFAVTDIIREFVGVETTAWVATPDEDTVILGSEAAAADAIDLHRGEGEAIGGGLREAHEVSEPGPVTATLSPELIGQPVTQVAGVVSPEIAFLLDITGHKPEYLSVTYNVRDSEQEILTFDVVAAMADASAASDLFGVLSREGTPDVTMENRTNISDATAVERTAGEQNGRYLELEIPTLPAQATTYIADFVDEYGPDPEPVELVPEAADGVLSVDGTAAVNSTTTSIANEAFASGLVAGAGETTVEGVADSIYAQEVTYRSTTTFYGDNESYVGTYVKLDKDPNEFINSEVREQYSQATGGEEMSYRGNEDSYRHADIYSLAGLDAGEELPVTRALSGFIADGTTDWVTPVSDDSLVFGSKNAVQDVVDIYRGVEGPAETPLHRAHGRTSGQIALSGTVTNRPVAGYADAIDSELGDALSGQDTQVLSVGYRVGDDEVTLDIQFRAADRTVAGELFEALDGVLEGTGTERVHERASVSQDGQYVRLRVPYGEEKLLEDIQAFVDAYGTELFPESRD